MAKKFLVATGVVGLIAVGVWAGPIRILDWGPHRPQVDPNVLAALILKIMDPNTEVRFKAVEELGRLRATEAFSVIVGRLSDKAIVQIQIQTGEMTVAAAACTALGLINDRKAVPLLIPLLEDKDLKDYAAGALCLLKNPGMAYLGQVVHAATGRPMTGVFVLAATARCGGRFSDLTEPEWAQLDTLETHPSRDSEALKAIRKAYRFLEVVRTDQKGMYELHLDGGTDFYSLLFFARDFVPTQYRTGELVPDASGHVEIPLVRLCPAAKVQVHVEADLENVSLAAQWCFIKDLAPPWALTLFWTRQDRRLSMEYAYWYAPNVPQWVYVPADVPLYVQMRGPGGDDRLCPYTYPQPICLPQGDVMDLGPCSLPKALKIVLRILDPKGRPREGVPVHSRIGRTLCVTRNTDEKGLATFNVPPNSSGDLGVFPLDLPGYGAGPLTEETVPFTVGGEEDQDKQFDLVLSQELLSVLFRDQ